MFSKELITILEKYKEENKQELNTINKDILDIIFRLKAVREKLSILLSTYINNDLDDNKKDDLFHDLKILSKHINSIETLDIETIENLKESTSFFFDKRINVNLLSDDICPMCNQKLEEHKIHYQRAVNDTAYNQVVLWHRCPACRKMFALDCEIEDFDFDNTNISLHKDHYEEIPNINIYSVVVLCNTLKCSLNHKTKDIVAKLPVINESGELHYYNLPASYCFDCNRFTILKDDFHSIKDVVMCRVIDETTELTTKHDSEIEIAQKNSPLYNYGYNVKTKTNLSDKQRQIILASAIEANLMNRRDIINHLKGLIARGSKIPSWNVATKKWTQDQEYVRFYENGSLPEIIFNEVILKYRTT